MARHPQPPTRDEHGALTHPAFGQARVNRVQSQPGAVVFDSEVRHLNYVTVEVSPARVSYEHGGRLGGN